MKRTLFAVLAALTLCVTMTIVCPLSLIALKSPRSSSVDLESSAPVGSSARISCGCVIRARATAALCFCPPDTSYGYLFRSLLIPSCSAIARSGSPFPCISFQTGPAEGKYYPSRSVYPKGWNLERRIQDSAAGMLPSLFPGSCRDHSLLSKPFHQSAYQCSQDIQKCSFATSAFSHNCYIFACFYGKADVMQRFYLISFRNGFVYIFFTFFTSSNAMVFMTCPSFLFDKVIIKK